MEEHQYKDFWAFMKLLSDNQLLEHVVVIGSWAEYLYAQAELLPGFTANLRTLDIDVLVKNMKKPSPQENVLSLAKESGYSVDYDILDGTTKIYTPGLMEIEFLIAQKGSGENSILDTNLGVRAQALRHIAILKEYPVQIELFNMRITVPQPEAYVAHKIIINNERGKKAEKDLNTITIMLPFLNKDEAIEIFHSLTKKEQRIVISFFSEHSELKGYWFVD